MYELDGEVVYRRYENGNRRMDLGIPERLENKHNEIPMNMQVNRYEIYPLSKKRKCSNPGPAV